MKKLIYLSTIALVVFASCTKDDFGVKGADPQTNPQEEAVTIPTGVEATPVEVINLAEVTEDYVNVALCTPVEVEGADYVYEIDIEGTALNVDEPMMVAVADLKTIVEAKYGKRPVERTLNAVIKVSALLDGQAFALGKAEVQVKVIPAAPFIDSAYYLVGDMCAWGKEGAKKFNHSGKDVYEDPVFTIVVDVPNTNGDAGDYWKVIPATNYDGDNFWAEGVTGVVGVAVDGDSATEGTLVTASPQAAMIPTTGLHKITLNMMDYTYSVVPVNFEEYIYIPGNHQGWTPESAQKLWSPAMDGIYTGFCALNGDFKFTRQPSWGAEYNYNSFTTLPDGVVKGEGDGNTNIVIDEGFYYLVVDAGNGSLTATSVSWGIVGSAVGTWDDDNEMTWDADRKCWTAKLTLQEGQLKFRANRSWDVNLGGSFDNLTVGGGNLDVTSGTYVIDLYCERTDAQPQLYCTLTPAQ